MNSFCGCSRRPNWRSTSSRATSSDISAAPLGQTLLAAAETCQPVKEKLREFKAGDNWTRNIAKRNGLHSKVLHGEAGSINNELIEKGMEEVRAVCAKFPARDTFNVDETGVQWKLMARRTYFLQSEEGEKEDGGGESTKRGGMAPPDYAELSSHFGFLERAAQESGNRDRTPHLQKTRMSMIAAQVSKPARQADRRNVLGENQEGGGGGVQQNSVARFSML